MRVLITGGAGYIGYSLTKKLLQSESIDQVLIYDNLSRKNYNLFIASDFDKKRIRFIEGELLDSRKLQMIMNEADAVIHLAAKVTTPFADREFHFFDQINHWGTAELVYAVENADHIKQLIYLSSVSVYGSTNNIVDEDYAPHPQSFYGISKKRGEEQVLRLKDKIDIHIIRSGNVYGFNPAVRLDAVINRFMFEAQFNRRITINGNGEQVRAFIHIDKIADALDQLVQKNIPSGIFNLAEYNLSINEIAGELKKLYPDLETLNINQNMQMKNVSVKIPGVITDHIELKEKSFSDELTEFKNKFSF